MNKKTLIIIAVIAVAAFLIWRKSRTLKQDAVETGASPKGYALDDVIAVAFDGSKYFDVFAKQARKVYSEAKKLPSYKAELQQYADKNGISYIQAVVINGAFRECYKLENGVWIPKDKAHEDYYFAVRDRVINM